MRNHLISFALSLISESISASPDPVRLSLEAESAKWFCWLLISGAVVALGCVLEVWETYVSLVGWWRKRKDRPHEENETSWRIPLSALGLFFVIVGVIGETIFEGLVSNTDTAIRTHESEVLSSAETKAAAADQEAGDADERAGKFEKDAAQLKDEAAQANRRAAEANRTAENERLSRVKLQKELQPRRLTGRQKEELAAALGSEPQPIVIGFCGFDGECIDFANDIGDGFKKAHWTPTFIVRTIPPSGIEVGFMKGSDPLLVKLWVDKVRLALATAGLSSEQTWFDLGDQTLAGGFQRNVLYVIVGPRPAPKASP
jgi:hypothetical protein